MHKDVWRYTSMRAAVQINSDGLVEINVTGLVNMADLKSFRKDMVKGMALPGAVAMLIDYRKASVLIDSDSKLPRAPIPSEFQAMPLAIVCAELDERTFLAHAWAEMKQGLTRSVFTEPEEASSWVLARADGSSAWG